jgi:hypothetical protein
MAEPSKPLQIAVAEAVHLLQTSSGPQENCHTPCVMNALFCAARISEVIPPFRPFTKQSAIAGCVDNDEAATITSLRDPKAAAEVDKHGWGSSDLCAVSGRKRIEQLLP